MSAVHEEHPKGGGLGGGGHGGHHDGGVHLAGIVRERGKELGVCVGGADRVREGLGEYKERQK